MNEAQSKVECSKPVAVFGAAMLVLAGFPALAQEPLVMTPVTELAGVGPQEMIIGGRKADPHDWPATFVFKNLKGGGCTSTAIGKRVVLTAAHCVADGASGTIKQGASSIALTCHHHPDYQDNVSPADSDWEKKVSPDFALCSLTSDLSGVEAEWVNSDSAVGGCCSLIHLVGYGCNAVGGTDHSFGVLFEGDAAVFSVPAGSSYYTRTMGGAAVCYGDSGGAAYSFTDPQHNRRFVVGVNSRGDISTLSLLSTVRLNGFTGWAKTWSTQMNVRICGIHSDATGCRPQ